MITEKSGLNLGIRPYLVNFYNTLSLVASWQISCLPSRCVQMLCQSGGKKKFEIFALVGWRQRYASKQHISSFLLGKYSHPYITEFMPSPPYYEDKG